MTTKSSRATIYHADEIRPRLKNYKPFPQAVASDAKVKGIYFDGYPKIVKHDIYFGKSHLLLPVIPVGKK
jgi:hypothetical protein